MRKKRKENRYIPTTPKIQKQKKKKRKQTIEYQLGNQKIFPPILTYRPRSRRSRRRQRQDANSPIPMQSRVRAHRARV